MFNSSNKIYSKALKESGFTDELEYLPNEYRNLKRMKKRKAKERLFNLAPPYSNNIRINVS